MGTIPTTRGSAAAASQAVTPRFEWPRRMNRFTGTGRSAAVRASIASIARATLLTMGQSGIHAGSPVAMYCRSAWRMSWPSGMPKSPALGMPSIVMHAMPAARAADSRVSPGPMSLPRKSIAASSATAHAGGGRTTLRECFHVVPCQACDVSATSNRVHPSCPDFDRSSQRNASSLALT